MKVQVTFSFLIFIKSNNIRMVSESCKGFIYINIVIKY